MEEPRIQIAGLSDLGKERENQEDAWVVREPATGQERRQAGRLMVVADGIGGSRSGEVASALAARIIPESYFAAAGPPRSRLRAAVQEANRLILEETETNPGHRGMGTTVVAAVIHGDRLTTAWVGDSRAYLVRGRSLVCLTRDHRGAGLPGFTTPAGGLSRWLGMAISVDPDVREISLQPGDRILLCTDGLHGVVREEDIVRASGGAANRWAGDLVQLALKHGAPDNVTVICCHVDRLPFAPHRHPDLAPGALIDGIRILGPVGADAVHLWLLGQSGAGIRLICAVRPELQGDPGVLIDLEADEESLSRMNHPGIADVEGADAEKSMGYVCLRLPWQEDSAPRDSPTELHSLADVLEMMRNPAGPGGVMQAVEIALQVAEALAAVRDSLLPAGAPHPADFWGDGRRYALCLWPSARRQYCIQTSKGVQADPSVRPWMPPDFAVTDQPGHAADAYFIGWLLSHLLGAHLAEISPPPAVAAALRSLLADSARERPDAVTALRSLQG